MAERVAVALADMTNAFTPFQSLEEDQEAVSVLGSRYLPGSGWESEMWNFTASELTGRVFFCSINTNQLDSCFIHVSTTGTLYTLQMNFPVDVTLSSVRDMYIHTCVLNSGHHECSDSSLQ